MSIHKKAIRKMADKFGLQIVYAFGSRAAEALEAIEGMREHLSRVHHRIWTSA